MANCIACGKSLGMLNTPMFKKGMTKEYGTICTNCHMSLAMNGAGAMSGNVNQFSNQEVIDAINNIKSQKEQAKADKKEAYDRKVEAHKNKMISNAQRLDAIKQTIGKLNPSVINKREVAELPNILLEDETIEKVQAGYLDEGKGATGNGLLVATNYRLIAIDKSLLGIGIKMEDFPYDKITSVSVETGFLKSVLKIICSGNTAKVNLVAGAKEFSEFVRQKTLSRQQPAQSGPNNEDILAQIEKLADLRQKGILTDEEFSEKKISLLSKL